MDHRSYHPTASEPPPAPPPHQLSEPPQRRQNQLQGPRPEALKISQESHQIRKPPRPPPRHQQPVIIYAVSPKVIHTEVSDFMSVVQRLTGLSSEDFIADGSVSPAARLAATEKVSPGERGGGGTGGGGGDVVDILGMIEGVEVGQVPGILSPAPTMLPPVPAEFFSPAPDPNTTSLWHEMSPFFHGNGGGSFMVSPSALLSSSIFSPLHSPDVHSLFMDF